MRRRRYRTSLNDSDCCVTEVSSSDDFSGAAETKSGNGTSSPDSESGISLTPSTSPTPSPTVEIENRFETFWVEKETNCCHCCMCLFICLLVCLFVRCTDLRVKKHSADTRFNPQQLLFQTIFLGPDELLRALNKWV